MGAKTWMLVASDGVAADRLRARPTMDEAATIELVKSLYPSEGIEVIGDADLTYTCPPDDEIIAGCFPGVSILAASEFAGDFPSRLPRRYISGFGDREVVLHAMHSVVDWFAFAVWRDGIIVRSLSLSPDSGVLENTGQKFEFEKPYWAGAHPAVDPEEEDEEAYPFAFHPLELGEAALDNFFGFQLEGFVQASHIEPESVKLLRLRRVRAASRPWWKFW